MSLHCEYCGCPGQEGKHYCSHCKDVHKFIAWDKLQKKRDAEIVAEEAKPKKAVSKRSTIPFPNVIGDEIRKDPVDGHMDWSIGENVTSKSERRRKFKELGMIEVSTKEEYRDKEVKVTKGTITSHSGQKSRGTRKAAVVCSKAGQQIL